MMAPSSNIPRNSFLAILHRYRGLMVPAAATCLIFVILVPLPMSLMDLLLICNITLAAVILLTSIYVTHPLEFSVFPSLLLGTTLLRLVLNTATTRLILTAGDRSSGAADAIGGAGKVIETFGNFVAGGSLAVGLIIFIILVVIQFVVITKGATRISEVAARFTLDAMPGKQMAIDADLNAGLIDETAARTRRQEINREADFYGAMDGASKFVRGDAIAGIVITLVNILGGLYVGMVEYHWSFQQCLGTFTRLTIGDGLVSQIPAFIISIAAGLIVTRSTARSNLGEELLGQLTSRPVALAIAAAFLGTLMITPLPKIPLLLLGGSCAGIAILLHRGTTRQAKVDAARAKLPPKKEPEKIESLIGVEPMELEVGYGLVRLVDKSAGGDLLDRIAMIRRQVAGELGIVVPPIRIRDNMQLGQNDYAIRIRGSRVAGGHVFPGQYLAMDSGVAGERIPGTPTTEPAFGLPALWIDAQTKARAEIANYTVVEPTSVLATHLTEVIKSHAHELLTRQQTHTLLETLKEKATQLVEEVVGAKLETGEIQKVLQNLLHERVSIRDMETILETIGDWAARTKDVDVLTEYVRNALARSICAQYADENGRIHCVTLDPALEDLINSHIERTEYSSALTLPPMLAARISERIGRELGKVLSAGRPAVVLCSPQVRAAVKQLIEPSLPSAAVLAYNEIVKSMAVESLGMVTVEQTPAEPAAPARPARPSAKPQRVGA
ncbi:MAG: Flagellar biosynthesis protein FlhA [Phycisphaerae bacterium]|nr:Flagellar biosynthesis protein FlhA [Phycisphaerae bacterium]